MTGECFDAERAAMSASAHFDYLRNEGTMENVNSWGDPIALDTLWSPMLGVVCGPCRQAGAEREAVYDASREGSSKATIVEAYCEEHVPQAWLDDEARSSLVQHLASIKVLPWHWETPMACPDCGTQHANRNRYGDADSPCLPCLDRMLRTCPTCGETRHPCDPHRSPETLVGSPGHHKTREQVTLA